MNSRLTILFCLNPCDIYVIAIVRKLSFVALYYIGDTEILYRIEDIILHERTRI